MRVAIIKPLTVPRASVKLSPAVPAVRAAQNPPGDLASRGRGPTGRAAAFGMGTSYPKQKGK